MTNATSATALAASRSRVFRLQDIAVVDYRAPKGLRLRNHEHEQAHVLFMLEGGFEESSRAHDEIVDCGVVRFSPPGDRHQLRFGPTGGRCLMLHVPERLVETTRQTERVYARSGWLMQLASELESSLAEGCPAFEVELLITEILVRGDGPERASSAGPPQWIRSLRDRLHDDPLQSVSLAELSALTGRHANSVARAFRRNFGCSVGVYARRLRLAGARRRVVETQESLAEIALGFGFADQSHMTRWFHSAYGVSPGVLRSRAHLSRS